MRKILFVGKNDDVFVGKFLQRQPSYIYISASGIRLKNLDQTAIFIYDTNEYLIDLNLRYNLILFKSEKFEPFKISEYLLDEGTVIRNTNNEQAKKMLEKQKIPAVTVGINSGNISVSSITENGITFFCENNNLLFPFTEKEERFIKGNFLPAGIFPAVVGEIVSLLCKENDTTAEIKKQS